MRRRPLPLTGIAAFLLALGCGGAVPLTAGALAAVRPTRASETIAYSMCTARGVDYCAATSLFSSRADGSRRRLLVPNAGNAAWSPNGRQIAYTGPRGIWVARADGTGRRRLTTAPRRGLDSDPSWSPDGRRIAFHREWEAGDADAQVVDLYAVALRPRRVTRLTQTPEIWEFDPAWSPDGTHIAYDRGYGGDDPKAGIYVLDVASGRSKRLTRGEIHSAPDWSPDGRRMAFSSGFEPSAIVVMKRNGSGRRTLVSSRGSIGSPSWSPDGSRIAYDLLPPPDDSPFRIVIRRVDGKGAPAVIQGGSDPDWRPLP